MDTCVVPKLLKLLPKEQTPGQHGSDSQQGLHSQVQQDYQTKTQLLMGTGAQLVYYTPKSGAEETSKKACLQFPPGRALTIYFPSCCLRVQLPIRLYVSSEGEPPLWDTDRSWHTLNY